MNIAGGLPVGRSNSPHSSSYSDCYKYTHDAVQATGFRRSTSDLPSGSASHAPDAGIQMVELRRQATAPSAAVLRPSSPTTPPHSGEHRVLQSPSPDLFVPRTHSTSFFADALNFAASLPSPPTTVPKQAPATTVLSPLIGALSGNVHGTVIVAVLFYVARTALMLGH